MKWLLAAMPALAPAAALAQSTPVPIAPETWPSANDTACASHNDCNREGSVGFALTVSPAGRVTGCEIIESSSDSRLDERTCRLLIRRARFSPAQDKDGTPVEGRFASRLHWKIPDAPPASEGAAG
jgi:protein TonB